MTTQTDQLCLAIEAEETVFADRYSNNGAGPMWCYSNTCIVRVGGQVFACATERVPGAPGYSTAMAILILNHDRGLLPIDQKP